MIKVKVNNEYKDVVKIFCGGTLQKEITKVWSGEAQEYVYESSVEYTGSLPITISANGDTLIDYRIYGADSGVGEPTENLINASLSNQTIEIKPSTGYVLCKYVDIYAKYLIYGIYDENDNKIWGDYLGSFTSQNIPIDANTKYFKISIPDQFLNAVSLVEGRTVHIHTRVPKTYIPYGYKLPMVIGNGNTAQTTLVYIGGNQLDSVEGVSDYVDKSRGKIVRMIGEYTFTGDESFNKYGNSDVFYTSTTIDPVGITTVNTITMRCDHPAFTAIENKDTRYWLNPEADDICCFLPGGRSQVFLRSTSNFATATECKAYLKAQYDNGTPVKISYWLKTPVKEDPHVPFPDIPTINGETVIDYDGTPKPSQMYVKYRR